MARRRNGDTGILDEQASKLLLCRIAHDTTSYDTSPKTRQALGCIHTAREHQTAQQFQDGTPIGPAAYPKSMD